MRISKLAQNKLNIATARIVPGFVRRYRALMTWLSLAVVLLAAVATVAYYLDGQQKNSPDAHINVVEVQNFRIALAGLCFTLGWSIYQIFDTQQQRRQQRHTDAWDRVDSEAGKLRALEYLNSRGDTLKGRNLKEAQLENAQLEKADFCKANLSKSNLKNANLAYADLSSADLRDTDLRGANLHGANLSGAMLNRAKLSGADLSDANLPHAMLTDAVALTVKLERANLRNTELDNVDLRHSNLQQADLNGANLTHTKYTGVNWTGATMPDGSLWVEGSAASEYLLED